MAGDDQITMPDASQREPAVIPGFLVVGVAAAATVALWHGFASTPIVGVEDMLVRGMLCTLALWLVGTAHAMNALAARREADRLEAAQSDSSLLVPGGNAPAPPKHGVMHPAALLLGVVALGVTLGFRYVPAVQPLLDPQDLALLAIGAIGVSWILALGAAWGWWRVTKRRILRAGAEANTHLAQAAIGRLPVMFSLCAPDGRRLACNERFSEVYKRPFEEVQEDGWRESVHQPDRTSFDAVFKRDPGGFSPVAVEYGVTTPGGDNRWIREQFLPERIHGVLHGYVAVGVDITNQIRNETEYVEQIDALKEKVGQRDLAVGRIEAERDDRQREIASLKKAADAEAERASKRSTNLDKAREQRDAAKADLKQSRAELTATKSESSRLASAVSRLEQELEEASSQIEAMTERHTAQAARLEQYKSEAEEARHVESQLRTKVKRLTEDAQRQVDQIDVLAQARDDAEAASSDLAGRFDDEVAGAANASRAIVVTRANAIAERIAQTIAAAPEGATLDALEASLAIAESIGATLDGQVPARERAFDLRTLVRDAADVAESLTPAATRRITAEVDPEFPASVYGDSYRLRAAILQMASLLAGVSSADSLTIKLSHFGTLPSMVSVRLEFIVTGESLDADATGTAISPEGDPSPEAEAAWRRIGAIEGDYGAEATDEHTLTVWLTTTLMRRMTAEGGAAIAPAPQPAADSSDNLPSLSSGMQPMLESPAVEPPRIPQEDHDCSLGAVLELGQTTAKIRTTRSLHGNHVVRLTGADGNKIEASARVESSDKIGPRKFDTLVRFVDLSEETRATLRKIAMMNRRLTFIARDEPAA